MKILKELRNESGLTQAQFAQAIGTSQKNISRWEIGETEPSVYYLKKIAEFFKISTDYILEIEDDLGNKTFNSVNVFTPEECKILNAYHALSQTNKQMILRMLNIE
ncbi:MAG: helix-turn-helix transcriptional regulator [Clostridia bacterium]|nr:helix-turn-helix transcriptional regulator [Clostridia bacterium]